MGKRGRAGNVRLLAVCTQLNTTELELSHRLGLSLAALKSIDHPTPPLYIRLALAALVGSPCFEPVHQAGIDKFDHHLNTSRIPLAG